MWGPSRTGAGGRNEIRRQPHAPRPTASRCAAMLRHVQADGKPVPIARRAGLDRLPDARRGRRRTDRQAQWCMAAWGPRPRGRGNPQARGRTDTAGTGDHKLGTLARCGRFSARLSAGTDAGCCARISIIQNRGGRAIYRKRRTRRPAQNVTRGFFHAADFPEPRRQDSAQRPSTFALWGSLMGICQKCQNYPIKSTGYGGAEGIRTLETVSRLHP